MEQYPGQSRGISPTRYDCPSPNLNQTQEIAKEKEIIEIADDDDMDIIEELQNQLCTECERSILFCECCNSMDEKIDSACFEDDDYDSNLISSSSEDDYSSDF